VNTALREHCGSAVRADYNFTVLHSSQRPALRVVTGPWSSLQALAQPVRMQVFVQEQGIATELEWDEWDARSLHAVALAESGSAIATGRLLPPEFDEDHTVGHIGRMAVLGEARRQGVGGMILATLLKAAPTLGFSQIVLHAQSYVVPFYAGHGFMVEGAEFIEAGIPHRTMRRPLEPA